MTEATDLVSPYPFLLPLGSIARGSVTERVTAVLREAIVESQIAPGTMLDKAALCARLGVSRFPVSEALAQLAREGLVEVQPQRGTRVTPIEPADVREAMFLRRTLEMAVARFVAETGDAAVRDALERNMRYQEAALEAGDRHGFHECDLAFHALLIDALGYERVRAAIDAQRGPLERMRRAVGTARRQADTFQEHRAIVDGIRAGDGDAAAAAMGRHLDLVLKHVERYAAEHPALLGRDA